MAVSYPATWNNFTFRRIEANFSLLIPVGQQMTIFKGDMTIDGELNIDGEVIFI